MSVNVRYEANGPKVPLVRVERSIPEPTDNGIVIKTYYAGICHSDVHAWQNVFRVNNDISITLQMMNPSFRYPQVFGHEISGEVFKVGKNVTNVKKGDKVCVYPWLGCSDCTHCNKDMSKRCYKKNGSIGILEDGGFQTHCLIPHSKYVLKVDPSTDLAAASMFGCSVLTAYNSIRKILPFVEKAVEITGTANVLLIAMGGVGLWGLAFAKAMLPKKAKIICADISEDKLISAKEMGADETLVWGVSESKEEIKAKTMAVAEGGVDCTVDYFGMATTLEKIFECANKGAAICIVGLGGGIAPFVMLNLVFKEITLLSVLVGTPTEMKDAIDILQTQKPKLPPFRIIKPEEITDTMLALDQGKAKGRNVVDFTS